MFKNFFVSVKIRDFIDTEKLEYWCVYALEKDFWLS